jgi:DNA repair photolyase
VNNSLRKEPVIVADAGLLDPKAGTVGLDKFDVDLWLAYSSEEAAICHERGLWWGRLDHRGKMVGGAMAMLTHKFEGDITKEDVLFLCKRKKLTGRFNAPAGTTCGEWTPTVDAKGERGFIKGSPATGWCPAKCSFCYLLKMPFRYQSLALNVGEYEQAVKQQVKRWTAKRPLTINLGETGGLVEFASEMGVPELVQAYIDATIRAGAVPYILSKRALVGLDLKGAHVGISLNPTRIMAIESPGANSAETLLAHLQDAYRQGASTVIRWGPIYPGMEIEYSQLAKAVHRYGLGETRFTVDLLRFSTGHPSKPDHFEYRAHKWQESAYIQRRRLMMVRSYFPKAVITGCKLDVEVAKGWVKEGIINSMPCACWSS